MRIIPVFPLKSSTFFLIMGTRLVLVMAELKAIIGATRIMDWLVNPAKASAGLRIPKTASRVHQVIVVMPIGYFCHTKIKIINARINSVMISWVFIALPSSCEISWNFQISTIVFQIKS